MRGDRKQLLALVGTLRWMRVVLIVATVALTLLSHFFDGPPVLTSASLAGLALGLGAQALIRNVLGGLLITIENQRAVGDMIEEGLVCCCTRHSQDHAGRSVDGGKRHPEARVGHARAREAIVLRYPSQEVVSCQPAFTQRVSGIGRYSESASLQA